MARCPAARLVLAVLALACACGEPAEVGPAIDAPPAVIEAAVELPNDLPNDGPASGTTMAGTDGTGDAGPRIDPVAALPPTELPLTLLATICTPNPADAMARIRNDDTGVIRQYHVGDPLAVDATLAAVSIRAVQIQRPGDSESLAIGSQSVELREGDVYYPDLVEPDDFVGVLTQGLQLPPGLNYVVKRPDSAWGTPHTIRAIQEAIRDYHQGHPGGPKIHVGDISRRGGGLFPPHLSHRHGRDVDVGYVLKGDEADAERFQPAGPHNLDVARSWALLSAFIASGSLHYVFADYSLQRLLYDHALAAGVGPERLAELFQYPRGRHAPYGLIRHWRGHVNHFHVRFHE